MLFVDVICPATKSAVTSALGADFNSTKSIGSSVETVMVSPSCPTTGTLGTGDSHETLGLSTSWTVGFGPIWSALASPVRPRVASPTKSTTPSKNALRSNLVTACSLLRIRNSTSCLLEGAPHSIRTGRGRSLAQMSIAKQIAEASKSPRPARSGDRHSRCPQRARGARPRAVGRNARTSLNLCWPPPATAASPPDSCDEAGGHRGRGLTLRSTYSPSPSRPSQVRPRRPCPPRPLSICPQRSSTHNSVRDRSVELHHQPSVDDPRVLPKPSVPSRLGRDGAATARSTTYNTSTPTLRSEQTAVDRSGRCD